MLLHLTSVLNASELAALRQALQGAVWVDGRRSAGPQSARVKHNRQLDDNGALARTLGETVRTALARHRAFHAAALPRRISPPLFNRYDAGGDHYGNHVDNAIRAAQPGGAGQLRADLSATLFLSEPADYDGGELVVDDAFEGGRARLAAGDLVLYPGHFVHRVEPLSRGVRLAVVFWVESLVRSVERRQLLYEMDRHLTTLREQPADAAAVLGLTASYHHLLRMWAET